MQHHSYATGGHGKDEYFGEPDKLNDRVDGRTAETCNVYNMLKMTRRLFALRPDAHYADFHERALFNHILASMDPEDGRTCYMVPVGRGVQHEYQDMSADFTCCVGSGMESHALHGDGIYYESGDTLWVNLYVPSTAEWTDAGVKLAMDTDFPEGETATLTLTLAAPREFTLALRRPAWAGDGFRRPRQRRGGARTVPARLLRRAAAHAGRAATPSSSRCPRRCAWSRCRTTRARAAILWGPLVLAGDLGPEDTFEAWQPGGDPGPGRRGRGPWPSGCKPVPGKPGHFRTAGVGNGDEVEFLPVLPPAPPHLRRLLGPVHPAGVGTKTARVRRRARAAAQAGSWPRSRFVQPGEMQPERDFNFQGEDTEFDGQPHPGRACRRGDEVVLLRPAGRSRTGPMALVVTYYQDEWRRRTFDILVDGQKIAEQVIERGGVPCFYDVSYAVPIGLLSGKSRITVRFQADGDSETAKVFGIRLIRAQ